MKPCFFVHGKNFGFSREVTLKKEGIPIQSVSVNLTNVPLFAVPYLKIVIPLQPFS
jgi:hypothetical protein